MTTTTPARNEYAPRVGSLASRLIRYLSENPGTQLTPREISTRFHREYTSVDPGLGRAVAAGLLIKTTRANGTVVYSLPDLITEGAAA